MNHKPADELNSEQQEILREAFGRGDLFAAKPSKEYTEELRQRLLRAAATFPVRKLRDRRRTLLSWLGATAIAGLVAVMFLTRHPSRAWALTIERARQSVWIHVRMERDESPVGESWISPQRDIVAAKFQDTVLFLDYRLGNYLKYDAAEHVLYRSQQPPMQVSGSESLADLDYLFRRRGGIDSLIPGKRIVSQSARQMAIGQSTISEYQFVVEDMGDSHARSTLVLTADDETGLPQSVTVLRAGSQIVWKIDYPETGPTDERAPHLGIPEHVPVLSAIDEEQIGPIIRAIRNGRQTFDDYEAVCIESHFRNPRPLSSCEVTRISRRRNQWRIDLAIPSESGLTLPLDYERALAVWRAHRDRFRYEPVAICDGRNVHLYVQTPGSHERTQPAPKRIKVKTIPANDDALVALPELTFHLPEFSCRPVFWTRGVDRMIESIDEKRTTGSPADPFKIAIRPRTADLGRSETIWFDGAKGFVATQIIRREPDTPNPLTESQAGIASTTCAEFRRSPQGLWFPTLLVEQPADKSRRKIVRFVVDFSRSLDAALFETPSSNP